MSVICWDYDGTLVYSYHLWSGSLWQALQETDTKNQITIQEIQKQTAHGFTWHTPEEDYHLLTGEKWWEHMNHIFYQMYRALGVDSRIAYMACQKIRRAVKEPQKYHLFPDTIQALKTAKEDGHHNVLLSNNYPDLDEIVRQLGLYELLEQIIVSGAVGYDKPRPEIFEMVKRLYPDETDFIMVGDSISADVEGGRGAGMKTILVHKGFSHRADFCFQDLISVCDLLRKH